MRFRTFDGTPITDIVEYVRAAVSENPMLTVSVGCDSSPQKPATYVVTVMMYDATSKSGAHVVYARQSRDIRSKDVSGRLQLESEMALAVAETLDAALSNLGDRQDLTDFERKRYKHHLLSNEGLAIGTRDDEAVISAVVLTDAERSTKYRHVDLHMDYNAQEMSRDTRGVKKNKSNLSYKTWVPYLRGLGYRVFVKPVAYAASSAADILLH
jgi:predicted RNase H-related nuclease YkuK (DUF458 family)